jgi:hypothetical protein
MQADTGDAGADLRESVFGEVDEGGSWVESSEAIEEWGGGGEADGEVEPAPTFRTFRRASQDTDAVTPDLIDAPVQGAVVRAGVECGGPRGWQHVE